jgi:dihydroflavonol-4-reductase
MANQKVLVTGADGLLGSHVVRLLIQRGYRVSALILPNRKTKTLSGLDIELVEGNVLDEKSVVSAMDGVDFVIHIAALTYIYPDDNPSVRAVNIDGTEVILKCIKKHGIKRLVYVGSANSFGPCSEGGIADETSPFIGFKYQNDYILSKYTALQKVLENAKEGLNIVAVAPTFMLGAYDALPGSGAMIIALHERKVPGFAPGGKNYVCTKDVAVGIVNALTMGQSGAAYILGHENLSYEAAFRKIAEVIAVRPPRFIIPRWLLLGYGFLMEQVNKWLGKSPMVSYTMARLACDNFYYSPQKAIAELHLPQTPIEEGIKEAFDWFKENGYL